MTDFDQCFKALADPTRRVILIALRGGAMNAGRLAEVAGVAPNALSFHLRVLRAAGLIRDQRRGQFIRYSLNADALDELGRFFVAEFSPPRAARPSAGTEGREMPRPPAPKEGPAPAAAVDEDEEITLL